MDFERVQSSAGSRPLAMQHRGSNDRPAPLTPYPATTVERTPISAIVPSLSIFDLRALARVFSRRLTWHVSHFTRGATDPLTASDAQRGRFVPLADGGGDSHLGCAHLDPGAVIRSPSLTHAVALLIVHGRASLCAQDPGRRLDLSGGVGAILEKDERYSLTSETGAILIILEADQLAAHSRGISTPVRIAGQTWPSDSKRQPNGIAML